MDASTQVSCRDLPPYEYAPLNKDSHAIRLFKIDQAADDDEIISGELVTVIHPLVERHARLDVIDDVDGLENDCFSCSSHSSRDGESDNGLDDDNENTSDSDEDDIACDSTSISRNSQDSRDEEPGVEYRALSYEWGSSASMIPIRIDGHMLHIRKNLHDFLVIYRMNVYEDAYFGDEFDSWPLRTKLEYIWIDQICINQSDTAERGSQVQMMHAIFRHTTEVVAWLGDVEEGESALVTFMHQDQEMYKFPEMMNTFDYKVYVKQVAQHDACRKKIDSENALPFNVLCRAPFWSRLWAQQELCLTKQVVLAAGEAFFACLQEGRAMVPTSHYGRPKFQAIKDLLAGYPRSSYNELQSMTMTLCDKGMKKCTDPRDKIFGLQAMTNASSRIRVDYEMSVEDVFSAAFLKALRSENLSAVASQWLVTTWTGFASYFGLERAMAWELIGDVIQAERPKHADSILPSERSYIRRQDRADRARIKSELLASIQKEPRLLHEPETDPRLLEWLHVTLLSTAETLLS